MSGDVSGDDQGVPWTTAGEHAEEITAALDDPLSESAEESAHALARKYEGETGRTPRSVAAAAVYLVGLIHNEKRTQEEISEASGRSEVSIRDTFHELADREGYDLPSREPEAGGDGYGPDDEPTSELAAAILKRVPGWSA